jgi:hypothetical protein
MHLSCRALRSLASRRSRRCLRSPATVPQHHLMPAQADCRVDPRGAGQPGPLEGSIVPDSATPRITYRMVPAMHLLRGRQPAASPAAHTGLVRLTATRLHRAATLLIDWDQAAGNGWPRLQPPSSPLAKRFRRPGVRRYAGFPWPGGKWT